MYVIKSLHPQKFTFLSMFDRIRRRGVGVLMLMQVVVVVLVEKGVVLVVVVTRRRSSSTRPQLTRRQSGLMFRKLLLGVHWKAHRTKLMLCQQRFGRGPSRTLRK